MTQLQAIQRRDDEALLYCLDLKDAGFNYNEMAKMLGRDRSNISKQVRAVIDVE